MEEPRPLKALHDVEVDDVDMIGAVEGLLDGLIGGEVREFDERSDGVVDLEGVEEFLVVGFGGRGEGGVGAEVRADDAGGEGVGEVGADALGGGAEGGGELGDFGEELAGVVEVVDGDALGALEEEAEEAEAGGVSVGGVWGGVEKGWLRRRRRWGGSLFFVFVVEEVVGLVGGDGGAAALDGVGGREVNGALAGGGHGGGGGACGGGGVDEGVEHDDDDEREREKGNQKEVYF